jgi:hypothetical protein
MPPCNFGKLLHWITVIDGHEDEAHFGINSSPFLFVVIGGELIFINRVMAV